MIVLPLFLLVATLAPRATSLSASLQNILANTDGSDLYRYPTDLTRGIVPLPPSSTQPNQASQPPTSTSTSTMLDPVVILTGCLLAAGGWALPHPAPLPLPLPLPSPSPPSADNGHDIHTEFHDLDSMFPPGQLSKMGKSGNRVSREIDFDPKLRRGAAHDDGVLARYYAYEHAVGAQQNRIVYVMTRDDDFLDCMIDQMAHSPRSAAANKLSRHDLSFFFFAADVCQRDRGLDFGIRFPRIEYYLPKHAEFPEYSEANIRARVEALAAKKSAAKSESNSKSSSSASNAFQHALPPAVSKTMTGLASTAHRLEVGWKKARWAQWEAEPTALLRLESHY
ncbi:MAG: hypothetical protein M1826_004462 [Phylliscum demangeonii]|nr:MAG: hypothetical protein M1826_004462 [Phylliscum demangeonii]